MKQQIPEVLHILFPVDVFAVFTDLSDKFRQQVFKFFWTVVSGLALVSLILVWYV